MPTYISCLAEEYRRLHWAALVTAPRPLCYLSQSTPTLFVGIPDGRRVTAVQVRWPDGTRSEHLDGLESHAVEIRKPNSPHPGGEGDS